MFVNAGDEMDEKRQLDEQMRAVMDKFKYKRRQIRELQDDLHVCLSVLKDKIKCIFTTMTFFFKLLFFTG